MFCILWRKEATTGGGQLKGMFLKISQKLTVKHLRRTLYFNEVASDAWKVSPARVFSCEFCKVFLKVILKNTSARLTVDTNKRNNEQMQLLTAVEADIQKQPFADVLQNRCS